MSKLFSSICFLFLFGNLLFGQKTVDYILGDWSIKSFKEKGLDKADKNVFFRIEDGEEYSLSQVLTEKGKEKCFCTYMLFQPEDNLFELDIIYCSDEELDEEASCEYWLHSGEGYTFKLDGKRLTLTCEEDKQEILLQRKKSHKAKPIEAPKNAKNLADDDPFMGEWEAIGSRENPDAGISLFAGIPHSIIFFVKGSAITRSYAFYEKGMGFACPNEFSIKKDKKRMYGIVNSSCAIGIEGTKFAFDYKYDKDKDQLTITKGSDSVTYQRFKLD